MYILHQESVSVIIVYEIDYYEWIWILCHLYSSVTSWDKNLMQEKWFPCSRTAFFMTVITARSDKLLCNYNIDPLKALEDYEHIKDWFVMRFWQWIMPDQDKQGLRLCLQWTRIKYLVKSSKESSFFKMWLETPLWILHLEGNLFFWTRLSTLITVSGLRKCPNNAVSHTRDFLWHYWGFWCVWALDRGGIIIWDSSVVGYHFPQSGSSKLV